MEEERKSYYLKGTECGGGEEELLLEGNGVWTGRGGAMVWRRRSIE